MHDFPKFAEFFHEVRGMDPFPWQSRLAQLVVEEGWPSDIGVPTGLGKTATIDIAVWAMAREHDTEPGARRMPRRIWYVVDRRLLVDAAAERAESLVKALQRPVGAATRRVSEGLSELCPAAEGALHLQRLRGGFTGAASGSATDWSRRVTDAAMPAVICSTVDMYGSRLLFRGYGASRSMAPIEAALAGTDALVLLDEAHLATPLQRLVAEIRECDANISGIQRPPGRYAGQPGQRALLPEGRAYPVLVSLTATGAAAAFNLDDDDRQEPVVQQRLRASKPTTMRSCSTKMLGRDLVGAVAGALAGRTDNPAAVVFVNRPRTARAVAGEARKRLAGRVLVLTGQLREFDAQQTRRELLAGARAGAEPVRSEPLIVVATQTLEVGADLDFDICVSQSAGVRALTQRWGRLNRLGGKRDAVGVIVHAAGEPDIYGDESAEVWTRLEARAAGESVNLSPESIGGVLGQPQDVSVRAAELLPAHLWEFAKTSLQPSGAAPPEAFFDDLDSTGRTVAVLWRAYLPNVDQAPDEKHPIFPAVAEAETVSIPVAEARAFLETRSALQLSDDGVHLSQLPLSSLRPGTTIILSCDAGGYDPATGWNPEETATVRDVSPFLRGAAPANRILHLIAEAGVVLSDAEQRDIEATLDSLSSKAEEVPDDEALLMELRSRLPSVECLWGSKKDDGSIPWLELRRVGLEAVPFITWEALRQRDVAFDELDGLSTTENMLLSRHAREVGEFAGLSARALGLPPEIVRAVEHAGQWHDVGKCDPRFQAWLENPGDEPLAKSTTARRRWRTTAKSAGWPGGARHELLSGQILDEAVRTGKFQPEEGVDLDVIHHLVVSHHGRGRSLGTTVAASRVPATAHLPGGDTLEIALELSLQDWRQPGRFRGLCERYGYWGVALLEAVVRLADHRASNTSEVV